MDEALKCLRDMDSKQPPKAIVLHVGTNDLRCSSPEKLLPKYVEFRTLMRTKCPGAKFVYSSVAPREDDLGIQRNVAFLNAAVNRKFGGDRDFLYVNNKNLKGPKLKADDGIHLKDEGTSSLARGIRDGVIAVLNIENRRSAS